MPKMTNKGMVERILLRKLRTTGGLYEFELNDLEIEILDELVKEKLVVSEIGPWSNLKYWRIFVP